MRYARAVCADIAVASAPVPVPTHKPAEIAPQIAAEAEEKSLQPRGRTSAASRLVPVIASLRQSSSKRPRRLAVRRGAAARAPTAVPAMQHRRAGRTAQRKTANGNGHSKQNGSRANSANGLHKSKPVAARSLSNGHAANGKPAAKSRHGQFRGAPRLPDLQLPEKMCARTRARSRKPALAAATKRATERATDSPLPPGSGQEAWVSETRMSAEENRNLSSIRTENHCRH